MKIDIRPRFENLLKWLIPFFLLSVLANVIDSKLLGHAMDAAIANKGTFSIEIKNMLIGLKLIKFLFNIAVAVWLYFQAKDLKFNRFLWPIFGLIKPSGAIVIFMLILVYESMMKTCPEKLDLEEREPASGKMSP
nr:hypothetical protein [uncultured Desulfuromonas sp.]